MNGETRKKLLLLVAVLAAVAILAGCTTNPDQTNKDSTAGAGYNGNLPWDVLTTVPPVNVTEAPPADITTPEVSPGTSILPFQSPDLMSGAPQGLVTLTPAPMGTVTMVPTAIPTATPRPTATPLLLKEGSKGAEVRNMQTRLRTLGYLAGAADGDFGAGTATAVRAFQRRNNLPVDGVAGPATLARLNSNNAVRAAVTRAPTKAPTARPRATATPRINENIYLKIGSQGAEVRRMQQRLIELGYLEGTATGTFNAGTQAAVIAFQKRNVSYYDGIAGPLTLSKLYSNTARRAAGAAATLGLSLKLGLENSDAVRTMQRRLKDLGYYAGVIDGDFGLATEQAVRSFQANNRLTVDGMAGESTLGVLYSNEARRAGGGAATNVPGARVTPVPALTPIMQYINVTPDPSGNYVTLRPGNSGVLVNNLQQALKNQGYLSGVVDGKYGVSTMEAVQRFQADHGLSQDGIAGAATQRTLFEGQFPIGS